MLLAPSPALLLARLRASGDVVEQSGSLRFSRALLRDGEGRRVGSVSELGPLGVQHADVDGDRGETEQGHHKNRDEDADGPALAVPMAGLQPLHSITPLPSMANGPAIPVMVDRL